MIIDDNSRHHSAYFNGDGQARYYPKGILRPRLMSAADYVFYLKRHLAAERRRSDPNVGYPGDENLSAGIPRLPFLLRRLEEDIQSSYLSFLEEFASDLHDGIGCLLSLLRTCHERQKGPGALHYATCSRGRQNIVNKGTTDELYCLLCLKAASKSSTAVEKITVHKIGLSTIAACIMSCQIKSRIIAIELLTIACRFPEVGVFRVLEAMTTVRIIFGESVRFKFLVSMLNSNLATTAGFETVILIFLNTLLDQLHKLADRVRVQCELEEAGMDINYIEKELRRKLNNNNHRVWSEIDKWRELQVDLQNVMQKHQENLKLKKEVELLKNALKRVQEERTDILTIHKELRGQWHDMEQRIQALALKTKAVESSTDEERESEGKDTPLSTSSESTTRYSKMSQIQNSHILPDTNDSELEEILIDIPTIKPGSILEVKKDTSSRSKVFRSSHRRLPISDVPPPLPPNHPKLSDSGISSQHDSDADLNINWHYPEIPEIQVEKRHNSVRVRFSESTYPKSVSENFSANTSIKAIVLPPGRNKTKCADIIGVQNCPKQSSQGSKKSSSTKSKNKMKSIASHLLPNANNFKSATFGRKSNSGNKLWNRDQQSSKFQAPAGSSLNGMIHREIAKAIRERHALFDI